MPPLDGATGWLNTRPLTSDGLRGKVVLVDFWTYTCINWLRTLPYVRAWARAYADRGLVVLGVHTPEFPFRAGRRERPRGADGDATSTTRSRSTTTTRLGGLRQPLLAGRSTSSTPTDSIRHHRFGEGDYERSEVVIQELLAEAGATEVETDLVSVERRRDRRLRPTGTTSGRQETYLGYERTQNFDAPGGVAPDDRRVYAAPDDTEAQPLGAVRRLDGRGAGNVDLNEPNGRITFRFHARDVHLVMGRRARGRPCRSGCSSTGAPRTTRRGATSMT